MLIRTKLNLPKSGMGIEEATVLRWLKAVGDSVQSGEAIVEVETAKAVQEIQAPVSGKLVAILLKEGDTAAVNTTIGLIEHEFGR
jgi:pyruvate/2-oxoglutarate dehydrogenase complex dihydrolipoamide acyltransferase (E2) component